MKEFDLVYKINSIQNIIKSNINLIEKIFILKINNKTTKIINICKKKYIKIYYIKENIKEKKITYIRKNYDVVAKIKNKKKLSIMPFLKKKNIKILILDRIQDPYNLSACIRTSEAFGFNIIIISKKNTSKISSLIHTLSNGASLLIPIFIEKNIDKILEKIKDEKIEIIGLSAKADQNINEKEIKAPIAIIMGSEKDGIRKNLIKKCDRYIKIKMNKNNKSINLSVATGIVLSNIKF